MQSKNSSSTTDTNLSPPPFVCACRNKTFKSGSSSVVEGHNQTPLASGGGGGGAAPAGTGSGELSSAITIMAAAATELTFKVPPSKFHPSSDNDGDDDLAGVLELGNGVVEARKSSEASRSTNKKSYRHHPYDHDHKGWLSIGICGGRSSSSPGGGRSSRSSSETTASSERTISDPNLIINNHGENNNGGVEVSSSERTISDPNLIINHDVDDDLDLKLGVRVYDEVDLELRLKSWI